MAISAYVSMDQDPSRYLPLLRNTLLTLRAHGTGAIDGDTWETIRRMATNNPQGIIKFAQQYPEFGEALKASFEQSTANQFFNRTGLGIDVFTGGGGTGTSGGAPLPGPLTPPGGTAFNVPQTGGGLTVDPTGFGGPSGSPSAQFGPSSFLQDLLSTRAGVIGQQQQLLSSMGPGLRDSVFAASPELAQTASFFASRLSGQLPDDLQQNFREQIRTAQAARGFTGGGSTATQEAKFLTALQEQNRFTAAQGLQSVAGQVNQLSGLSYVPALGYGEVGGLSLGARTLAEQVAAGQQQSSLAQQMFQQQMALLNPTSGAKPNFSVIVGGGGLPRVGS